MNATIDRAGRVVIPREIRRQAGLQPGMVLDVRWRDGRVEIEPASVPVKLVREHGLLVAVAEAEIEPLTAEIVEETRDVLRRERAGIG